ncbi:MAG: DMT family transporter [Spirochaetota bacterium]
MESRIGELAALGTAICWTITALSFEAAGKRIGSLTVNIIRLVMAAAVFALFGWLVRGYVIPTDASLHAWTWLGLSGLVGFVIGDLFLFQAFVDIGARIAMLIYASVPPITALLGRLILDERLTSQGILGMVLTVMGIAIVVLRRPPQAPAPAAAPAAAREGASRATASTPTPDHALPLAPFADPEGEYSAYDDGPDGDESEAHPAADGGTETGRAPAGLPLAERRPHRVRGALFAFGGAVGQAGGLILGRLGTGVTLNPFAATQIRVFAGIIGFALLFSLTRRWRTVGPAVRNLGAMGRVGLGALFGPFLGVSLGLYAAQNTSTGIASTIMALVPVLIIVPSVVVFKERVTLREIMGAVVAVGGVSLLFL